MVPTGVGRAQPLAYSKLVARLQQRLIADHTQSTHFLNLAVGVGDQPVTRYQLGGDGTDVGDGDRVGKHVAVRFGV